MAAVTQAPSMFAQMDPSIIADQLALQRQQQLAAMLQDQGNQPLQYDQRGPVSWTQGLAQISKQMLGAYLAKQADDKAASLQAKQGQMLRDLFMGNGQAATPQQALQATADNGQPGPTNAAAAMMNQPAQTGRGPWTPANMTPQQAMQLYTLDPSKLGEALVQSVAQTPEQKMIAQGTGGDPAMAQRMAMATALKTAGMGPDAAAGTGFQMGPNGQVQAYGIQGAPQAAATMKAAVTNADESTKFPFNAALEGVKGNQARLTAITSEGNKPQQVWNPNHINQDGTKGGMEWTIPAANIPGFGIMPGGGNAQMGPAPQPQPPMQTPPQGAPQGAAPGMVQQPMPQQGPLAAPTPGEKAVTDAGAAQAVENAKAAALRDNLLATIAHAKAINGSVPSGPGAHVQAWASSLPLVGGGQDATAAELWDKDIGQNILSGLKTLQGMGRVDIPEVNQVIKTYGLDMTDHKNARAAGLDRLSDFVKNNVAVGQNTLNNLNSPNLMTPQAAPYSTTPPPAALMPNGGGSPAPGVQGMAQPQKTQMGMAQMPRMGEVRGGYSFRGGNPADPNSWIKVQ